MGRAGGGEAFIKGYHQVEFTQRRGPYPPFFYIERESAVFPVREDFPRIPSRFVDDFTELSDAGDVTASAIIERTKERRKENIYI